MHNFLVLLLGALIAGVATLAIGALRKDKYQSLGSWLGSTGMPVFILAFIVVVLVIFPSGCIRGLPPDGMHY